MSEKNPPAQRQFQKKILSFCIKLSLQIILSGGLYMWTTYLVDKYLPNNHKKNEKLKEKARNIAKKLNRPVPITNHYEDMIIEDIIFPEDISVTFDDIGGMEHLKNEIYEMVILPLIHPDLAQSVYIDSDKSKLDTLSKGVLFYGPPGTGKTMMAKAIVKECNATFINIRLSTLQSKWFGESTKLVNAIFSVAKKYQPSIIFLDEIDLILRNRNEESDHGPTGGIQAAFMTLWDGLTNDDRSQFTVLGATNRPFDIDKAILRRLPRQFLFKLPEEKERIKIIDIILQNQRVMNDFDSRLLAKATEGYSGSDLKELCRYASMIPIRKVIKSRCGSNLRKMSQLSNNNAKLVPQPLSMNDFLQALLQIKPTAMASYQYHKNFHITSNKPQRSSSNRMSNN